ncbi:hypothetical protein ACFRQM_43415 [Streptomyces sp. NPDC056831]|uniref:hypothetical protein n=1 Tax=Streptomyces sp. NPDC056831 TaxID=3345954 RepID=UPI0036C4A556
MIAAWAVLGELRRLLAGAESALTDFLRLATLWTATHPPDRPERVASAISRALTLP